ncbi:MAG: hypothetical protein A2Y62_16640 [Candidatus Fischerbacteria bacterium RBG_13_37_8]|uniref:NusG-like N-terminal domain-containing protein n=1 Tax=Candidatus Fischerbacteria bacterium RBG_13_37_8 TaxID=1817863 RepID=A0A1F5VNS0_9BACT|nr:MAG: hypothetical protein A2Y62_16640 [Candidatus Fischerbacteria bacterium RBG_13_37_8]
MSGWYALYSKWHHEKKVAEFLHSKNIEAYLPLISRRQRWKDRYKWVDFPLFPSYVFVYCEMAAAKNLLSRVRGVISIVGSPGPELIPSQQILSIKKVIETGVPFEHTVDLLIGQEVLVVKGPLKGIHGILVEKRNKNLLLIKVDLINQGISIIIEKEAVIPYRIDSPTPCTVINESGFG